MISVKQLSLVRHAALVCMPPEPLPGFTEGLFLQLERVVR